ncbi:MAG: ankyrin repeat domain-containing protein [archaeon]|nr:ankyrin repeat domain-containing protein [archaeon]
MHPNQKIDRYSQQPQPMQKINFIPPAVQQLITQLLQCIDNYDSFTFKKIIMENQLNLPTKNLLLNKVILVYLAAPPQISSLPLKQIITLLLSSNANPNIKLRFPNDGYMNINSNNNYALFSLVEKNDVEMVQMFLDNGAEVNICDLTGKNCLFHMMRNYTNCDLRQMSILLLNKGIKINSCDNNGYTPLMEIINKNLLYLIEIFIKYNVDVDAINFKDGNTALHYAMYNGNRDAIWLLLANGKAKIDIKNKNGESVYDLAKKDICPQDISDMIFSYAATISTKKKENEEKEKNDSNEGGIINKSILAKLEKIKLMNEGESQNNQPKEEVFIFPTDDVSSRVEIPFMFQQSHPNENEPPTLSELINSPNRSGEDNNQNNQEREENPETHVHSCIKIQNTPTLFLDISDETSREKLIFDSLKTEQQSLGFTATECEETLKALLLENESLKAELNKTQKDCLSQQHQQKKLNDLLNMKEIAFKTKLQTQSILLDGSNKVIQELCNKFIELTKDKTEENKKEEEIKSPISNKSNIPFEYEEYLKNKFGQESPSDDYLFKNLTEDIIDFAQLCSIYYEERMEVINNLKEKMKDLLPLKSEIFIYGSYSEKLALEWSDVDMMIKPIVDKNNTDIPKENEPQTMSKYQSYCQQFFANLKNANLVEAIQLVEENILIYKVKLIKSDKSNKKINIYLILVNTFSEQNDNTFIKSSELINSYINKYNKVLRPLVLCLKQILFNCSIMSNYTINLTVNGGFSSYALTVLIIYFLNSIENKETIKEENLGKLFIDFIQKFGTYIEGDNRLIYIEDTEITGDIKEYYSDTLGNGCDIIVVDPCDWKNNLTSKTYKSSSLKIAFLICLSVGKDLCECSCHYKNGFEKNFFMIDKDKHCVLNKMFKAVKRLSIGGGDNY